MGNRIKCELAGVVHSWTYSCFEALKVRDHRLEPLPHYRYYEDIRGNLEYIGPLGPPSLSMHKKRVNAVCVNPFCKLLLNKSKCRLYMCNAAFSSKQFNRLTDLWPVCLSTRCHTNWHKQVLTLHTSFLLNFLDCC